MFIKEGEIINVAPGHLLAEITFARSRCSLRSERSMSGKIETIGSTSFSQAARTSAGALAGGGALRNYN